MPPICVFCDKPCHGVVYEHVSGWFKRRGAAGGLNGLRLRRAAPMTKEIPVGDSSFEDAHHSVTVTHPVACSTCIALLEAGGNPRTQGALFGD